ncbi:MAG: RNA polymerase sigma factor [Bacteroidales bacterium]|nr:RNA polymerase sigma factor [Bacteroidales bacterium]
MIQGCRRGEKEWQRALYEKYSPGYYTLCLRYTSDEEAAKDMLMDGFVAIFRSINQYSGSGSLEAWMRQIFTHLAIRRHYKSLREKRVMRETALSEELPTDNIVEESMIRRDLLYVALHQLTDEQRLIVNLVAVEEYTFAEVAEMMHLNLSTLKSRYYVACERLKKILEEIDR